MTWGYSLFAIRTLSARLLRRYLLLSLQNFSSRACSAFPPAGPARFWRCDCCDSAMASRSAGNDDVFPESHHAGGVISPAVSGIVLCLFIVLNFSLAAIAATPFSFNSAPLKKRAVQLLDEGRFLECADAWNTVYNFSLLPADRAEALVRTGDVYALFLDLPDQALAMYERAIHAFPGRPELENAYFNAGMLLYETRRYAESESYFTSYLRLFARGKRRSTATFMLERLRDEMTAGRVAPSDQDDNKGAGSITSLLSRRGQEPSVRVAIANAQQISFVLSGDVAGFGKGALRRGSHTVSISNDSLLLNGQPAGTHVTLSMAEGVRMRLGDIDYSGTVIFQPRGGRVLVVNTLGLESYLAGVLPEEMPLSFQDSALQAQAIAARSYALYLMEKSQDKPFDVSGSTASQVYGGVGVGSTRTRNAVAKTRGRVLTYEGKTVLSYFHSHSGGMLEDDKFVWAADMPYYQVREDGVSNRMHPLRWQASLSAAEVALRMRENGFTVSSVRDIQAGRRSVSGRMVTVLVQTPDRDIEMKANAFRLMMGPEQIKSTLCQVQSSGGVFVFTGTGYGHGVGMSQWGAQGMAQEGRSVEGILEHYYPGTTLATVY